MLNVTLPLTVRSNSQRGADVRTPMRVSGRLARMALMTSMTRDGVAEAVTGNVEDEC